MLTSFASRERRSTPAGPSPVDQRTALRRRSGPSPSRLRIKMRCGSSPSLTYARIAPPGGAMSEGADAPVVEHRVRGGREVARELVDACEEESWSIERLIAIREHELAAGPDRPSRLRLQPAIKGW